ncbi:acrosin-like [Pollicipes pollicipes]|uniref:acrosin-like n=1 Tax=Pollicipes pollicipes TaxID=41117 RepID=UPI00188491E6|nr:acrosin-like [Pollicipes pollicipes]XP_037079807.1 acrosin-like [Pollicipes pollicipes]
MRLILLVLLTAAAVCADQPNSEVSGRAAHPAVIGSGQHHPSRHGFPPFPPYRPFPFPYPYPPFRPYPFPPFRPHPFPPYPFPPYPYPPYPFPPLRPYPYPFPPYYLRTQSAGGTLGSAALKGAAPGTL